MKWFDWHQFFKLWLASIFFRFNWDTLIFIFRQKFSWENIQFVSELFFPEITRNKQKLVGFLRTLDIFLCSVSAFSVSTYGLLHNTLYRSLIFPAEKNFEEKKFNSVVVVFFPETAHEASEFRSAESFVSFIIHVSGVTEVGSFWASLKVEIIDLLVFLKIIVSNWPFFSCFSMLESPGSEKAKFVWK